MLFICSQTPAVQCHVEPGYNLQIAFSCTSLLYIAVPRSKLSRISVVYLL
jgi:hypothetical protein